MSKPALNWYGEPLEDYQKPSCVFCLADIPHRTHVTALEAMQLDLDVPQRPPSLSLRDVVDRGGIEAYEAGFVDSLAETPAA